MKTLTWPQVVAVVAALSAVAVLAVLKVDTTAIVTLVIALLLGGVAGQVSQVRDQTNGNHSAMLETIREQSRIISRSPAVVEPPADEATSTDPAPGTR